MPPSLHVNINMPEEHSGSWQTVFVPTAQKGSSSTIPELWRIVGGLRPYYTKKQLTDHSEAIARRGRSSSLLHKKAAHRPS